MTQFVKDPQSTLDYVFDWSAWLKPGETISSNVVTATTGITVATTTATSTAVTVWLNGGTTGQGYLVSCRVTTNQGRTDERSFNVVIQDR